MHFNCVSFCIAQDAPDIIMNDGQLQSKNISFGDALSLSTCFTSEPYPVITWLHNGTIINHKGDPDVIIHTCNELRVANLAGSGGGNYTCRVSNEVGSDEIHYTIHIDGKCFLLLYNSCVNACLYASTLPIINI